MSLTSPIATVVVPAFNVTATISETLRSLQAQTLKDIEIVIVDDGSSDDLDSVLQPFLADPRMRLVRQPNRGLAGARNTGIAAARGQYVGFCDADDLWEPGKMAAHVAHLEGNDRIGLSYSGSAIINDNGELTGHAQSPRLKRVTTRHVFLRNPVGNGSAPVFRRAALEAIAWTPRHEAQRPWVFDETLRQSEDIECWLRLALTTDWEIEGIPGLLTRYRVNAEGLSANTEAQLVSWDRMVDGLNERAPDFFRKHRQTARAYQLRYLCRRAISAGDGPRAAALLRQAMRSSALPLLEEPAKTLTTIAATLALNLFGADALGRAQTLVRTMRGHA